MRRKQGTAAFTFVGVAVAVGFVSAYLSLKPDTEQIAQSNKSMNGIKTLVSPSKPYTATIIGATGTVGGELLRELLQSSNCVGVSSFGRREKAELNEIEGAKEKLTQHVVNLDDLENEVASQLSEGVEVAFITLGVGSPSKATLDEVYKVDVEYAAAFARACKRAGVRQISLLSSVGTTTGLRKYSEGKPPGSSAAAGSSNYFMIKSMIQDALENIGFEKVDIFQPSLLATKEVRFGIGDSIMQSVFPKISWMLPTQYQEVKVEDLGRAMRIAAEWGMEAQGVNYYTREHFTALLDLEKEKELK